MRMRMSLRPFKGQSLLPVLTFALMGTLAASLLLLVFVYAFGDGLDEWFIRTMFIMVPAGSFIILAAIHIVHDGLVRWPNEIDISLGRRHDPRFEWVRRLDRGPDE